MIKTKKTIVNYFKEFLTLDVDSIDGDHVYILSDIEMSETIDKILSTEEYKADVQTIYDLYPSKCLVRGAPLGKSKKDKDKIAILLRDSYTVEKLSYNINRYVKECKKHSIYMMRFATLLNNIPDYEIEALPDFYIEYQGETYVPEGFDSEGYPVHPNFIIKKLLVKKWFLEEMSK